MVRGTFSPAGRWRPTVVARLTRTLGVAKAPRHFPPIMTKIEELQKHDVDSVVRMWRQSFEYGVGIIDPHSVEDQIEFYWQEVAPNYRSQIAKVDEKIIGFLASNLESVSQLHVRVGHHRSGIGKQLLDLAKTQSCGNLWLYTFARNTNACAFYESQGFTVLHRGFEPFWQLEDVKFTWSRSDA